MRIELPTTLTCGQDGIWRSASSGEVSYPSDGLAAYFDVEDASFWFRHRNASLLALMRHLPPGGTILDIGGGTGYVAQGLQAAGHDAIVLESDETGARAAHRRGLEVICAPFQQVAFASGGVPAIGLFDVLEHIEDDLGALASFRDSLMQGGRIYLTVPAYNELFSDEDRMLGHFRRYSVASVSRLLQQSGFSVEFATYLFMPLPLPIFLLRTIPSRLGRSAPPDPRTSAAAHSGNGVASRALQYLLNWEVKALSAGRRIPFGSSCLLVARRSD